MRAALIPVLFVIAGVVCAGCTGTPAPAKSAYSVDSEGKLTLSCAPETTSEETLFSNETYTKSRIVFHTESGDVVTYLAAPASPKAAAVYVPGAGEKLAGHEDRMVRYAAAGYAFLFVDTRGNGGETAGLPFGQQLIRQDYAKFEQGEMPQYYRSICDLLSAQKMLSDRYHVPVYAIGSSNGGRYAAVATGIDTEFTGYIGISTSDWGLLGSVKEQGLTGDPVQFATSVEPSTYIGSISPRPVWIYHNATDPIIPISGGQQLFSRAGEPKTFTDFPGDHGINPETDDRIMVQWAQIYGPRG